MNAVIAKQLILIKNKMANSKLILTFNKDAVGEDCISFYKLTYGQYLPQNTTAPTIWRAFKSSANPDVYPLEIQITTPTSNIGEAAAGSFAASLSGESGFLVTRNINVVTIECENAINYFSYALGLNNLIDYYKLEGTSDNGFVSWKAENVEPDNLILDSVSFSNSNSLRCRQVKCTIATNKLPDIVFDVFRDASITKVINGEITKLTNTSIRFHKVENADALGNTLNMITFQADVYRDFMFVGNNFIIENSSVLSNNKKYTIISVDRPQWSAGVYNYTLSVLESVTELGYENITVDYSNFITVNIEAPKYLSKEDFNISTIQQLDNVINMTVFKSELNNLTLQYSLNDNTWQTSNIFNEISLGKHTLYIKDNFGCKINIDFTIENINNNAIIKSSFSYISESMSLRFKKIEDLDCYGIFKNDENTLSFEENVYIPYVFTHKFSPADLITTQLLTNYSNVEVNVVKCDGSKENVSVLNKINFINKKDKRDCLLFSLDNNKTGIIYKEGYIYDYDNETIIDSYVLNGDLPDYAEIGNSVFIKTIGWLKIADLIYDEAINSNVIVVNYNYQASQASYIISSNWNLQNYDVKEFTVDFSKYVGENVNIEINQSLNGFESYNHISEPIQVEEYLKDAFQIKWSNGFDTDVYYSTGIINLGNFNIESFKSKSDSEVVINKGINSSVMINSFNYNQKELSISGLSTMIAKKLLQAFLHKELYINNIKFICSEPPGIEQIENTNIYTINVILTEANQSYLSSFPSLEANILLINSYNIQ